MSNCKNMKIKEDAAAAAEDTVMIRSKVSKGKVDVGFNYELRCNVDDLELIILRIWIGLYRATRIIAYSAEIERAKKILK